MSPQDTAVFLPALIGALIFGLKKALGAKITKKYKNYIPWFAMVLGGLISIIYSVVYKLPSDSFFVTITQGVVVGAAAVGYREAATRMIDDSNKSDTIE